MKKCTALVLAIVFLVNPSLYAQTLAGKKIVFVNSYHQGYEWSDSITDAIKDVVTGTGVELNVVYMDTKRNAEEAFKKRAALRIKEIVEAAHPDVMIVADDNAFKYLVMPYYRNAALPVVFCGLNWDASLYDVPYTNTTGMVEVAFVPQLIDQLKHYASGTRVGYLSADVLTERKNMEYYQKTLGLDFEKVYFVKTMEEWEKALQALQNEVSLMIFENNAGIVDWDEQKAYAFARDVVKIPIGTTNAWMMPFSLIGFLKVPQEQGEWAAKAALRILHGEKSGDIPVVKNQQSRVIVNLNNARLLSVHFDAALLKTATILSDTDPANSR